MTSPVDLAAYASRLDGASLGVSMAITNTPKNMIGHSISDNLR